jgi:hypothetical protein
MQAIPDLIAMLVLAIVSADISLSLLRPAITTSREVGLYLSRLPELDQRISIVIPCSH